MKKFRLLILLGVVFLSCSKEEVTEPPKFQETPCMILSRFSTGGYIKATILIKAPFRGTIYVKYPSVGGSLKDFKPSIIDTGFVSPIITVDSRIAVNYGWGQIEK